MRNCKEITEQIEKENFKKLNWIRRIERTIHLILCKACRAYKKDSIALDSILEKRPKSNLNNQLTELEKQSMSKQLSK